MKLTYVFILASLVVLCIAPASQAAPEADDPELIAKNKLWSHHFVRTMLTMLHHGAAEKTPQEKYSMILEAFKPLMKTTEPFTSKVKFDARVDGSEEEKEAFLTECKGELFNDVIGKCEFIAPGFINGLFEPILKNIIWRPSTSNPAADTKDFLYNYTYFTPRVMRGKLPSFKDCVAAKLYAFYVAHEKSDKAVGLEEMTKETMKLIKKLADQPEDELTEENKSRLH